MTVTQRFLGKVSGPIAGRDVLMMDAAPLTEWEVQSRFRKATGIDCSKEARRQLERLMDRHDFTERELCRAHRVGSLRWDRNTRTWTAIAAWIDLGAAYTLSLLLSILFVLSMVGIYLEAARVAWPLLSVCAALYLAVLLSVAHMFVLPQRTARRAAQILGNIPRNRVRRRRVAT